MVHAKCTGCIKDEHGEVIGFIIVYDNGKTIRVKSEPLKNAILFNKIQVENIAITSTSDIKFCASRRKSDSKTQFLDRLKLTCKSIQQFDVGALGENRIYIYLAELSTNKYILYIPDDVEYLTYDPHSSFSTNRLTELRGNYELKVCGGSNLKDISGLFAQCVFDRIDFKAFQSGKVENMSSLFAHSCINDIDVEHLNTKSVKSMNSMFYRCITDKLHITKFDLSNVLDCGSMFLECGAKEIIFEHQGENKILVMSSMFQNTYARRIKVTLDAKECRTMECMFLGAGSGDSCDSSSKLEKIDISGLKNTYNVHNMSYMFKYIDVDILDISNLDVRNVACMNEMFERCNISDRLIFGDFNACKCTNMSSMFEGISIPNLNLSSFNTSACINMSNMFRCCRIQKLNVSSFDIDDVTNLSCMFADADIPVLHLENFRLNGLRNYIKMFFHCEAEEIHIGEVGKNLGALTDLWDCCDAHFNIIRHT